MSAGAEDEPPMEFQLAALSHFATSDQRRFGDFIRVLGLGGKNTFDYSLDPRLPQLGFAEDDYITFGGDVSFSHGRHA